MALLCLDRANDFNGLAVAPVAYRPAELGKPENDGGDDGQSRCDIRCRVEIHGSRVWISLAGAGGLGGDQLSGPGIDARGTLT